MSCNMHAIVMAGGEGKRMNSSIPKVLHTVGGEAMILRIVRKVASLNIDKLYIVCGKYQSEIKACINKSNIQEMFSNIDITYVHQGVPKGTGDAIKCCLPHLPTHTNYDVLILNGDTPLIDTSLNEFVLCNSPSLMVTSLKNPTGQGRIVKRETDGGFERIVEEKDATSEEKRINVVNCGVYLISSKDLIEHIPNIANNNAQSEYYLTDICGMLNDRLNIHELPQHIQHELVNVNTCQELNNAENIIGHLFFKKNNLQFRSLEESDFFKGYVELMTQLSDTLTISSFEDFKEILDCIRLNSNHHIYVIEDANTKRIIANITLIVEKKFIRGGKSAVHIEDVVVDGSYRGKNIGVQMLRYVNTLIYNMDAYKVILDCKEGLESFYGNSGFTKTAIQMSKYLSKL
jgi:dTDP-glucose pyrophosphorylase/predicted GNAT family N-acyltransferase